MKYIAGLDIGQSKDFTAIAILESPSQGAPHETFLLSNGRMVREPAGRTPRHIRYLQRFPLGTPYPTIVEEVKRLLESDELRNQTQLVIDQTGVGAPVGDMFRQAGLALQRVSITSGNQVTRADNGVWGVPKRDLISTVQVGLQSGALKIASSLPEAATLVKEFLNFQVKITTSANDTYGAWREGTHDDLLLAVSLAVWWAERYTPVSVEWL